MSSGQGGVTAVVLSGGRGRRFDFQDKGLLEWHGRPLVAHVTAALRPQVDGLLISGNRNEDAYRALGYEVVSDADPGFQGPIAGILAGLKRVDTELALISPCDSPNLPSDLVERLSSGLGEAQVAVVHDGERRQNLVALMRRSAGDLLQEYYDDGGRAVRNWYPLVDVADVDFSDRPEAFLNVNRPEDMDGDQVSR